MSKQQSKRVCARCGQKAWRTTMVNQGGQWFHKTHAACTRALDRAAKKGELK